MTGTITVFRSSLAALLLLVVFATSCRADQMETVMVEGRARQFFIHIPHDAGKAPPLVLAFHGFGGTAGLFSYGIHFDDDSDKRGFIVAYPQGLKRRWNVSLSPAGGPDDVAFTLAMIQRIQALHPVDAGRIYVAGMSNGGMFAHALACSGKIRLSAIAAVAGLMPQATEPSCRPAAGLSVLQIAATGDPAMPYAGGAVHIPPPANVVLSFANTVAAWAVIDKCGLPATTPAGDNVSIQTAPGCAGGDTVIGESIDSNRHSWAGGDANTHYPIRTSDVVIDFLLSH